MTMPPAFRVLRLPLFLLLVAFAGPLHAAPDDDPVIQAAFESGTLTEGRKMLEHASDGRPAGGDAEANRRRYALGIVEFLRAAEKLG